MTFQLSIKNGPNIEPRFRISARSSFKMAGATLTTNCLSYKRSTLRAFKYPQVFWVSLISDGPFTGASVPALLKRMEDELPLSSNVRFAGGPKVFLLKISADNANFTGLSKKSEGLYLHCLSLPYAMNQSVTSIIEVGRTFNKETPEVISSLFALSNMHEGILKWNNKVVHGVLWKFFFTADWHFYAEMTKIGLANLSATNFPENSICWGCSAPCKYIKMGYNNGKNGIDEWFDFMPPDNVLRKLPLFPTLSQDSNRYCAMHGLNRLGLSANKLLFYSLDVPSQKRFGAYLATFFKNEKKGFLDPECAETKSFLANFSVETIFSLFEEADECNIIVPQGSEYFNGLFAPVAGGEIACVVLACVDFFRRFMYKRYPTKDDFSKLIRCRHALQMLFRANQQITVSMPMAWLTTRDPRFIFSSTILLNTVPWMAAFFTH